MKGRRARGLLALVLALGGAVWLILPGGGLRGRYYAGAAWQGEPVATTREATAALPAQPREVAPPFSVRWSGWLFAPTSGTYRFALASHGSAYLRIDDALVARSSRPEQGASGEVDLPAGSHRIEVSYASAGGPDELAVLWTPPGGPEEPLPPRRLFVRRPGWLGATARDALARLWRPGVLGAAGLLAALALAGRLLVRSARATLRSSPRERLFAAVMVAAVLIAVEALSAAFFLTFRAHFTFFDLDQYLLGRPLQDEKIARAEAGGARYLALGWDTSFATPFGERPRTSSFGRPFMATFGDSFTHCDDVADHETWQEGLSRLLERDVYNFGVPAYGTDQAYLKFLDVHPRLRTPVVGLGVTTENINRIVNVYRPFYFPKTGNPSTKPRFVLREGRLHLLDNPVKGSADVRRLGERDFVRRIGANDWWYNRDDHPVLEFPYSGILFNRRMWLEVWFGRGDRRVGDIDPRPWANLWESEEARGLMLALLDAFVARAQQEGAVPVIVVLPLRYQVRLAARGRHDDRRLGRLLAACRERAYRCFDGVDALARSVRSEGEVDDLFAGHVSARGNRVLAEALAAYLRREIPALAAPPPAASR